MSQTRPAVRDSEKKGPGLYLRIESLAPFKDCVDLFFLFEGSGSDAQAAASDNISSALLRDLDW